MQDGYFHERFIMYDGYFHERFIVSFVKYDFE